MADDGRRGERQRVLIAGAGVAGLEAALALRDLAGDRVDVALHDPGREFAYRPFGIGEPYGTTRAFRYDLRRLSELCGASLHASAIAAVEPERRIAVTRDGERAPLRPPDRGDRGAHALGRAGRRHLLGGCRRRAGWRPDRGPAVGAPERLVLTMPAGTAGSCRSTSWRCSPPTCSRRPPTTEPGSRW